jgi:hypothetical protein
LAVIGRYDPDSHCPRVEALAKTTGTPGSRTAVFYVRHWQARMEIMITI